MRHPADLEESGNPGGRSAGYGILGQSFASGEVLALWRGSASSIGAPYTAVWHLNAAGAWTLLADVAPQDTFPPFCEPSVPRAMMDTIAVNWTGPSHFVVTVRDAGLVWSVELATTGPTRFLSDLAGGRHTLPWVGPIARRALGLGSLRLCGRSPAGQCIRLRPRTFRRVRTTRAAVRGRDFGPAREGGRQVRLGDFRIPARGIFAAGELCIEPG